MKQIFFLLFISTGVLAQTDSLIVENTFSYDLRYGISSEHRFCSNQKTFDKAELLLREFNYELDTLTKKTNLKNFTYYFYDDSKRLSSEEFYYPELELQYAIQYVYKSDNLTEKRKYISDKGKLTINETIKYKYKDGKLIQKTFKNQDNKKNKVVRIEYKLDQTIIIGQLTDKDDNYKQYDKFIRKETFENGKLSETMKLKLKNNNPVSDSLTIKYIYSDSGQLIEEHYYNNGKFINKKTYAYYPEGPLKNATTTDPDNKMTEFQSKNIERIIYNFGGLKSVFEKD